MLQFKHGQMLKVLYTCACMKKTVNIIVTFKGLLNAFLNTFYGIQKSRLSQKSGRCLKEKDKGDKLFRWLVIEDYPVMHLYCTACMLQAKLSISHMKTC